MRRQQTPRESSTFETNYGAAKGHCIRCNTAIDLNPDRPYCLDCYQSHTQAGGSPIFKERYCHHCGWPHKTHLNRPLCHSCWKNAQARPSVAR